LRHPNAAPNRQRKRTPVKNVRRSSRRSRRGSAWVWGLPGPTSTGGLQQGRRCPRVGPNRGADLYTRAPSASGRAICEQIVLSVAAAPPPRAKFVRRAPFHMRWARPSSIDRPLCGHRISPVCGHRWSSWRFPPGRPPGQPKAHQQAGQRGD